MDLEDSLELKQSSVIELANQGEENVNLDLIDAPQAGSGILTGVVYDTTLITGTPLQDATVTVYNATGNIIAFAKTNLLGQYTILGLLGSTNYTANASKDGYNTSTQASFTVNLIIATIQNFAITPNTNENLNVVYGIVKDDSDNPVDDAYVYLSDSSTGDIFSATTTIIDGEYLIYNVPAGSYNVEIVKTGYYSKTSDEITVTTKQNIAENTILDALANPNNGVISGIIEDSESAVVENAFVGLYSLGVGDVPETLVDYTFTNSQGRYVFGDVAPGSYIVKAKLSE